MRNKKWLLLFLILTALIFGCSVYAFDEGTSGLTEQEILVDTEIFSDESLSDGIVDIETGTDPETDTEIELETESGDISSEKTDSENEELPEILEETNTEENVQIQEMPEESTGNSVEKEESADVEKEIENESTEDQSAEVEQGNESEETNEMFSDAVEDEDFTVFTAENADMLTAETEEAQEIIEAIEEGEMLAVAAAAMTPDQYIIKIAAAKVYCDEVWDETMYYSTRYRVIEYVDSVGTVRQAPLYCLNASRPGIEADSSGDYIKKAAISFLSNSTLKKILYFGYGGPGDICKTYDPTCAHVDWSKWQNRFVFTHQALSKVYCNDAGGATASQTVHVGLDRFIAKIKTLTIPNRSAMKLQTKNSAGNTVTSNNVTTSLILYRTKPSFGFGWLESAFDSGFQITPMITVLDGANIGNGITVTRKTTDTWQLGYWTSAAEAKANPDSPTVLAKGKTMYLKHGYQFRIVFPKNSSGTLKWSYPMSFLPVQYVLVDGSVQMGQAGYQDFGAAVYQGTRGTVTLSLTSQTVGKIVLNKTSSMTGKVLSGAEYGLYAAEDIYSGNVKMYSKNIKVASGKTNASGQITIDSLIPGKYYVKELTAAAGYLLDTNSYSITVSAGKTITKSVTDTPDIKGQVSIEKLIKDTSLNLKDAEFTVYSWNNTSQKYEKGRKLSYDDSKKRYLSEILVYDETNKGKFKITETKNPVGFTGSWSMEIVLNEPGTEKTFSFKVENEEIAEKKIEIRKTDSETGMTLEDAEFVVYEWDETSQSYLEEGKSLTYLAEEEKYVSEILEITETNKGKFLVREEKCPEGYTGEWSEEIDLGSGNTALQYTVQNDPIPKKYGTVKLLKKDAVTGDLLPDAEFEAFQWSSVSGSYEAMPENTGVLSYTEQEQRYVSLPLEITEDNQGKFCIKETVVPEGYRGSWEKEILLSEDGEEIFLEAENEPIQLPTGSLTITKKIRQEDIVWANGNPTFPFVVEGTDIRGIFHKYEDYLVFVEGGFQTGEDGCAVVQMTFFDIPVGVYQVYEKPVLRYYLKEIQPQTPNVQIRSMETPSYGHNPAEIAVAEVELSLSQNFASILFFNEKARFDDYSHNSAVKNIIQISFKKD